MAPKALLVLAGVLLVLASSDASATAVAEENQQRGPIFPPHGCVRPKTCCGYFKGQCIRCCRTEEETKADTAAAAADQVWTRPPPPPPRRSCRCCWPYGGPCLRYCCFNGEVISATDVAAKAKP